MPTTVLYRKSSGEIMKISEKGQTFADRNRKYWGVLNDPEIIGGNQCIDVNTGDRRILGISKIWDGVRVRPSSQQEIESFEPLENEDNKEMDADSAINVLSINPAMRKVFIAYSKIMVNELNLLREQINSIHEIIANSNSLSDIKAQIVNMPIMPERKPSQLKAAIINKISKDD